MFQLSQLPSPYKGLVFFKIITLFFIMNITKIHKNSGLQYLTPKIQYAKDSIKPKLFIKSKNTYNIFINTCKGSDFWYFSLLVLKIKNKLGLSCAKLRSS